MWKKDVVVIEESHVVALGGLDPDVSCSRHSTLLLELDQIDDELSLPAVHDRSGGGARVVDEDYLEVFQFLSAQTAQAALERTESVAGGDDDTDHGIAFPVAKSSFSTSCGGVSRPSAMSTLRCRSTSEIWAPSHRWLRWLGQLVRSVSGSGAVPTYVLGRGPWCPFTCRFFRRLYGSAGPPRFPTVRE